MMFGAEKNKRKDEEMYDSDERRNDQKTFC